MRMEYNCPVASGNPKVAFREAISKESRYVNILGLRQSLVLKNIHNFKVTSF